MATVLVADDDPGIRAFVTDLLTGEGYVVRCAEDGAAALAEVVRAPPDVVLSDVRMPRLDGLALAARLRPLGVPVVPKPFDADALLAAVAAALGAPVA